MEGVVDRIDRAGRGWVEGEVRHAHLDRERCQRVGGDGAAFIGPGATAYAEQLQLLVVVAGAGDIGIGS